MAETWRLFIALELPPPVSAILSDTQAKLKQQIPPSTVRWVRPEGIHLTLKFLGDVAVVKRDSIQDALTKAVAEHAPFPLRTGKPGCFPTIHRPRVVWIGIEGSQTALNALQQSVEQYITPLGFPTETRPFNPHLTLGRVQREARREHVTKLGELINTTAPPGSERWTVSGISLMRSELKPIGAIYTQLFYAPLKQPDGS
ncbi:MAG: RNA 2',3'-cyclic phosphodiesterase [Anaerolineae bacterium]|nr:RNA 2',3'-cyclic phosphodiesterase [Anaerolineae bacterium]